MSRHKEIDEPSSTCCTSSPVSIMVPTCGCSTARTPLSAASVATRSRLESSRFHPASSSCGRAVITGGAGDG